MEFGVWILDFGFWILDFGSWILDFGFWILDFGFWSLDFGFWILDQFSIRSFCGGPKRRRLDFGFWILEFGFWILDFGVWSLDFGFWILDFGLDEALLDIVWILHKIFPCHADSGRRIFVLCLLSQPFKTNYSITVFKRTLPCKKKTTGLTKWFFWRKKPWGKFGGLRHRFCSCVFLRIGNRAKEL